MVTIHWQGEPPTLSQVVERFALDPSAVDERFGVVEIDPDEHLFALRLDPSQAAKLGATEGADGPFADPEIGVFGPPR